MRESLKNENNSYLLARVNFDQIVYRTKLVVHKININGNPVRGPSDSRNYFFINLWFIKSHRSIFFFSNDKITGGGNFKNQRGRHSSHTPSKTTNPGWQSTKNGMEVVVGRHAVIDDPPPPPVVLSTLRVSFNITHLVWYCWKWWNLLLKGMLENFSPNRYSVPHACRKWRLLLGGPSIGWDRKTEVPCHSRATSIPIEASKGVGDKHRPKNYSPSSAIVAPPYRVGRTCKTSTRQRNYN